MRELLSRVTPFFSEPLKISLTLFKILIPASIAIKIIKELGMIKYVGLVLGPIMELVGLPGDMGLVWATAMIVNLYTAAVVFISLTASHPLTVAQVTVLTSMMLVAHSLIIELKITQKAGCRIRAMAPIRIGGAFLFGYILNQVFHWGNWLQQPSILSWTLRIQEDTILRWAWNELRNLMMIFIIIFGLLLLLKALNRIGITKLLIRLFRPLLLTLGISSSATTITIVGMTMGIAYGGGLIIHEAQSGRLEKKDVFFALALMGLSHALIEDTLLMVALGGHLSGLFLGRLIFSVIFIFFLVKLVSRLSQTAFERYLFIPTK